MPITLTPKIGLKKQAAGDTAWHTAVNDSFELLDGFLGQTVVGNPNSLGIVAAFIGQRIFQPTNVAWWVSVAVGAGGWRREDPRYMIKGFVGELVDIPDGWALCDGATINVDGEMIETPDLSGMFLVGHSATDADHNITPDPFTTPKIGGLKDFVVGAANIQQFASPAAPDHQHTVPTVVGGNVFESGNDFQLGSQASGAAGAHSHLIGSLTPTPIENRPPYYTLAWVMRL